MFVVFFFHLREKEFIIRVKLWQLEESFSNRTVTLNEITKKKINSKDPTRMGARYRLDFRRANWCSTTQCQIRKQQQNSLTRYQNLREWFCTDSVCKYKSSTLKGLGRFSTLPALNWVWCAQSSGGRLQNSRCPSCLQLPPPRHYCRLRSNPKEPRTSGFRGRFLRPAELPISLSGWHDHISPVCYQH